MSTTPDRDDPTDYEKALLEILKKERRARRDAERKFKDCWTNFKQKRDKAELWEYRARKNLERLKTMTIKNSTKTERA